MSRQVIKHGSEIETVTPEELAALLAGMRDGREKPPLRVRATATVQLDATGSGQDEVYTCPLGAEFAARRVTLNITGATDPSTGNVPLNVAGKFVAYFRSGALIEYAVPISPNAVPQIPGVQSWGDQQGPYLRNGETFEVQAKGLTASAILTAIVEGLLY